MQAVYIAEGAIVFPDALLQCEPVYGVATSFILRRIFCPMTKISVLVWTNARKEVPSTSIFFTFRGCIGGLKVRGFVAVVPPRTAFTSFRQSFAHVRR